MTFIVFVASHGFIMLVPLNLIGAHPIPVLPLLVSLRYAGGFTPDYVVCRSVLGTAADPAGTPRRAASQQGLIRGAAMKRPTSTAAALLAALLTGCVVSMQPLIDDTDLIEDARLAGSGQEFNADSLAAALDAAPSLIGAHASASGDQLVLHGAPQDVRSELARLLEQPGLPGSRTVWRRAERR
jgi:hypothetical protein